MPQDDDTLSKLLRLKRHEQPPPEYFENFLREFQDRQRAEMLRRPVWRIALDRIDAFFGELSASQLSYATASVAVLMVAAVFTADMLQHPGGDASGAGHFAQSVSHGAYEAAPHLSAPFAHEPLIPSMARVIPAEEFFSAAHAAAQRAEGASRSPAALQVASGEPLTLNPQMQLKEVFQDQTLPRSGATHLHPRYVLDPLPVSYEAPVSF